MKEQIQQADFTEVETQEVEQTEQELKEAALKVKYDRFHELDAKHKAEGEELSAEELSEIKDLYTELLTHEHKQRILRLEEEITSRREAAQYLRQRHETAGQFINVIAGIVGFEGEEGKEIDLAALVEKAKEAVGCE